MGGTIPKQYLRLHGRTVVAHAVARLAALPGMQGVLVAVAEDDPFWPDQAAGLPASVQRVAGGAERCHSVLNALDHLADRADPADWVLVHDAARPCVGPADLERLVTAVRDHPAGGLLAQRIHDTVKRSAVDADEVMETVDRTGLWRAQTPQMFRLGMLHAALGDALEAGALVTDESSAMERAGHRPLLVEGGAGNIKITRPEDLDLAEFFLDRGEG